MRRIDTVTAPITAEIGSVMTDRLHEVPVGSLVHHADAEDGANQDVRG